MEKEHKLTRSQSRKPVRCTSGSRGEITIDTPINELGEVVRYSFVFIHHELCKIDNGRALGYDNAHGFHERHWMGKVQQVEYIGFETTLARFHEEIEHLKGKL